MYGQYNNYNIPKAKFNTTREFIYHEYLRVSLTTYCQQLISSNWEIPAIQEMTSQDTSTISYCQQVISSDWGIGV